MSKRQWWRVWLMARATDRRPVAAALAVALLVASAASAQSPVTPPGTGPTSTPLAAKVFYNRRTADEFAKFVAPERPRQMGPWSAPGDVAFMDLREITWSTWGEAAATATGTVNISWGSQKHAQAAVTVTLDHRVSCAGRMLYTAYSIVLAPGAAAPRDFQRFAKGSDPCLVNSAGYVAGETERERAGCAGACETRYARRWGDCYFVSLSLKTTLCRMKWRSWGADTTIGTGVLRGQPKASRTTVQRDYAIKVVLTRRRWCNASTMSYTRERATVYGVYGHGIPATGVLQKAAEDTLRRQIDRPGVKRHEYSGRVAKEGGRLYKQQGCEP